VYKSTHRPSSEVLTGGQTIVRNRYRRACKPFSSASVRGHAIRYYYYYYYYYDTRSLAIRFIVIHRLPVFFFHPLARFACAWSNFFLYSLYTAILLFLSFSRLVVARADVAFYFYPVRFTIFTCPGRRRLRQVSQQNV